MDSLIKVGFVGNKIDDIMLYFSRIMVNIGKKTAIVDASNEQLLKYSVPEIDNSFKITTYRNTDIYIDCNYNKIFDNLDFSKYEVVFINFGYNENLLNEYIGCEIKFVTTDIEKHNIQKLKEYLFKIDQSIEAIRIYRDIVDSKIDDTYLNNILDLTTIKYLSEYGLYLDDVEMACRIESQYNDIFKFNSLPKNFKEMIIEITTEYFGFNKKLVRNAFKFAEKGV